MGLYVKNERNQTRDERTEQITTVNKTLEKKSEKRNTVKRNKVKSIWEAALKYSGRIYSLAGLLCVVAAVIGAVVYAPEWSVSTKGAPVDSQDSEKKAPLGVPYGSPAPGTVTENTQVMLHCVQEDAVIYYEIAYDGKEPAGPTTRSAVFTEQAPIIITRDTKIKAFAYYEDKDEVKTSEIVTLSYKLAKKMEPPGSSISSGSIVPSGTIVNLPVESGKVYYTTDGSDPSDSSNTAVNTGSSVVITGKPGDMVTINACTRKAGATSSELVTLNYQISQYPGGVTTDTPSGSTLEGGTSIHLMTDVTGGTIYYTTGPDSPITAGTAGSSVVLSGEAGAGITVKAVAVAPNTTMTGSYASFYYKLMEQLAPPHASIKDGTRLTKETSVILKADKGKIYFTIDGTEPTEESHEYTAPIVVSKDMVIKAIAMEEGSENSEVSTFSYTFAEKTGKIMASVPSGTLQTGGVIKLSCATEGARIYYTTDGTDPSPDAEESVFLYDDNEGISIHRSVNIKAIAVVDGLCDSDILSLNYLVDDIPAEIEREKAEEEEEEETGLKPSDMTYLADRRVQPSGDEMASYQDVCIEDIFSDTLIKGTTASLREGVTLRAKEISISRETRAEIKRLLGNDYELICNYGFTLYENGKIIQPTEQVEIGIPIPEGYENADVMIVSINGNNGMTLCSTRREDGYIYARVSHLNSYAIAGAAVDENRSVRLNPILLISIAAGILALAGIGMIAVTVMRRKRY